MATKITRSKRGGLGNVPSWTLTCSGNPTVNELLNYIDQNSQARMITYTVGADDEGADFAYNGTDIMVAIQAAFDAASGSPVAIFIQEGSYNYLTQLDINTQDDVIIKGTGKGFTKLIGDGTLLNPININCAAAQENIFISDLTLDNGSILASSIGIDIANLSNSLFTRLEIKNFETSIKDATTNSLLTFFDIDLIEFNSGVYADSSSNIYDRFKFKTNESGALFWDIDTNADRIKIVNPAYLLGFTDRSTNISDAGTETIWIDVFNTEVFVNVPGVLDADDMIINDSFQLDAASLSGSAIKDEDNMVSDSENALATQQSIKAYVDVQVGTPAPVGSMSIFGGSSAPSGYFLCDGSAIDRTTYAALFAIIGTAYGVGNGSTTFNIPDMQGNTPVGLDTGYIDFNALGNIGGNIKEYLTISHLPAHNHGVTDPQHRHSTTVKGNLNKQEGGAGFTVISIDTYSVNSTFASTGISIQNTGSGSPHDNMPPFVIVNYIIKY